MIAARIALSLSLIAVAAYLILPVHARSTFQDETADQLAEAMLNQLAAVPAECSPDVRSVQWCGKLPSKTESPILEARRLIDAILTGGGARPMTPEWTIKKKSARRQFLLAEILVTIRIHNRSRLVTFSYPMQFAACAEDDFDLPYTKDDEITLPAPIKESHTQPSYPKIARVAEIESTVILQALVERDGTVGDLCILESSRPGIGFEEATIRAVDSWRFKPARFEGRPVEVYFTVRVDFEIREKPRSSLSFR